SKHFKTAVGVLALALACGAGAQSLSGVATQKIGQGLQIQIQGQDLGQPKTSWGSGKRTFQLTFDGKLEGKANKVAVASNGVNTVTYGWTSHKPARVHVWLHVAKGTNPTLSQKDGAWVVNFNVPTEIAPKMPTSQAFPDKVPAIEIAAKPNESMAMTVGTG